MHSYGSSIIVLTNPDNELHKMELAFRSMIEDKDGNLRQLGPPLMNDLGINSVLSQTQAIVSRVTILSNLTKQEIPVLVDFLGDTLAKDLMVNKTKYGIRSTEARDKVFYISLTTAYICMKRAFEEGDKRFWRGSVQEIKQTIDAPSARGGLLSRFMGWGRKK